ncbi:ester cyclase (plasmid) [Pseudoalteromonas sp. KG3]|uniref:ester cyclase n=1 Tax=Pseudoalteromonas TaxID=53246 RepID=UPI002657AD61|nr:ester cyclase [Pseudoalteromonas sp. KG3]WKD26421.1 ester cyclase [Pseudoalteromonas sp. KG3]
MKILNNADLVTRFYQLIEDNNYAALKEICHEDFRFYSQLDTPLDIDGFLAQEKGNMDGFPGFTFRIHEMFVQNDKVACYLIFEGVNSAAMHGVAPTNNSVRFSLMAMLTIKDGKVIEKRVHLNDADIQKQLDR